MHLCNVCKQIEICIHACINQRPMFSTHKLRDKKVRAQISGPCFEAMGYLASRGMCGCLAEGRDLNSEMDPYTRVLIEQPSTKALQSMPPPSVK